MTSDRKLFSIENAVEKANPLNSIIAAVYTVAHKRYTATPKYPVLGRMYYMYSYELRTSNWTINPS